MSKKDRFKLKGHTIAGTFRVDDVVAEGGFGIVYRAFHLHFRSPVALKCLKIPGELSDEERLRFLEQFRSEAEIQFRLSAAIPHVVRPLHVDAVHTEEGEFVPLMALEWLEGRSFERIIEQRVFAEKPPMSLVEAVGLIGPAAQALHHAHNFKVGEETLTVVHRDIKPDNLFLTTVNGKPTVKILDFGISKVRRAATQLAGHFSQTSGTAPFSPAYGAPEQWVPKRFGQTGPWTDVWGLALTLVEIIKGDAVIVGDHQAMMGTALDPKVRPTPRAEGLQVSDEVEDVFQKALSLDPRYRYQSIEAFWQALQAAIDYSGERAQLYDETPSGNRIPLPPMSAPTPWASRSESDDDASDPFPTSLPPMMAPAFLEVSSPAELNLDEHGAASYPINPNSDLKPVPAAPTSWHHFDPEVPPSSVDETDDEEGEALEYARLRPDSLTPNLPCMLETLVQNSEPPDSLFIADALELDRISSRPPSQSGNEPSIRLDLEPTSSFPASARNSASPTPLSASVPRPTFDLVVDLEASHAIPTQGSGSSHQKVTPDSEHNLNVPLHDPSRISSQSAQPPPAPSHRPSPLISPSGTPRPARSILSAQPGVTSGRPPLPTRKSQVSGAFESEQAASARPPPPVRSKKPPPPRRDSVPHSGGPPTPPSRKPLPRPPVPRPPVSESSSAASQTAGAPSRAHVSVSPNRGKRSTGS